MKRILLLLTVLLLIGSASAWAIDSPAYSGDVQFYEGYGVASVDGYPQITFTWYKTGEDKYSARYLWYAVDFECKDGIITSESFKGHRLIQ